MKFFGSKKEPVLSRKLVIDVRSASVSVAVLNTEKKKPEIEFVTRKEIGISPPPHLNVKKFVKDITTLIHESLAEIVTVALPHLSTNKKKVNITEVLITYSSPWNKVLTKEIKIKKDKPFTLTEKKFIELAKKEVLVEQARDKEMRMVESDITHILLNGYEVTEPFGKQAKAIEASFYVGFVFEDVLKSIERLLKDHLGKVKIVHRTFPIILFSTLRDIFINTDTFTFFDVSGEVTDFGFVENGSLVYTESIPIGKNTMTRSISSGCVMDDQAAVSIMTLIARDEAAPNCNRSTEDVLQKTQKEWVQKIRSMLDEANVVLPKKAFVMIDGEAVEIVSSILKVVSHQKDIFETDDSVQVIAFDERQVGTLIGKDETVKTNVHAALSALFFTTNY